jgi:hypothetical protein
MASVTSQLFSLPLGSPAFHMRESAPARDTDAKKSIACDDISYCRSRRVGHVGSLHLYVTFLSLSLNACILQLTGVYPRKVRIPEYCSVNRREWFP